jgi:hypothetical protein
MPSPLKEKADIDEAEFNPGDSITPATNYLKPLHVPE